MWIKVEVSKILSHIEAAGDHLLGPLRTAVCTPLVGQGILDHFCVAWLQLNANKATIPTMMMIPVRQ